MFNIKIAGMVVGIDNKYRHIEKLCEKYISNESNADFFVSASQDEIDTEIISSGKALGNNVSCGYAESICIYRKIARTLPRHDAFVFHASAVECDGKTYMFSARSGTGKSTHTNLWLEHFGDRARIINGDKPVLRLFDGKTYVCGTPWCGKEGFNSNDISPLHALCFLERGEKNEIRRIDVSEAVMRCITQILIPDNENEIDVFFPLLEKMLLETPAYVLRCNISDEAVTVAYNTMKN